MNVNGLFRAVAPLTPGKCPWYS